MCLTCIYLGTERYSLRGQRHLPAPRHSADAARPARVGIVELLRPDRAQQERAVRAPGVRELLRQLTPAPAGGSWRPVRDTQPTRPSQAREYRATPQPVAPGLFRCVA